MLLRFRCTAPEMNSCRYFSYKKIAKALSIPYNTVQHICRYALRPAREPKRDKMVCRLEKKHIDYLTSASTLEKWAGYSLKYRTILFHRKFTDKRIAVTSLRRLYLNHGIKRKKVRQEKHMPGELSVQFQRHCRDLLEKLREVKQ